MVRWRGTAAAAASAGIPGVFPRRSGWVCSTARQSSSQPPPPVPPWWFAKTNDHQVEFHGQSAKKGVYPKFWLKHTNPAGSKPNFSLFQIPLIDNPPPPTTQSPMPSLNDAADMRSEERGLGLQPPPGCHSGTKFSNLSIFSVLNNSVFRPKIQIPPMTQQPTLAAPVLGETAGERGGGESSGWGKSGMRRARHGGGGTGGRQIWAGQKGSTGSLSWN